MRNVSLAYKLFFISLASVIIIGAVTSIGYFTTFKRANDLLFSQAADNLRHNSQTISDRLGKVERSSAQIGIAVNMQAALATIQDSSNQLEVLRASSALNTELSHADLTDIISYTIYIPHENRRYVWGYNSYSEPAETLEMIYALCRQRRGGAIFLPSAHNDGTLLCARQILEAENLSLRPLGYSIVRFRIDDVITSREDGSQLNFMFLDGNQVYPVADSNAFSSEKMKRNEYTINKVNGEDYFFTYYGTNARWYQFEVVSGIKYSGLVGSLQNSLIVFSICLILAICITLLIALRTSRSIYARVNVLLQKIKNMKSGNFSLVQYRGNIGTDELGVLNNYFDEMTLEFKRIIEDNYIKEILVTKAHLKSLEQQLNPHFLYNSLETINWFAKKSGGKNISTIVESLGDLLRSCIGEHKELITVKEEIAFIQSYLKIQCIRFEDNLEVQFIVPEESLDWLIPKMSIQPLVENAILHSLEENIGVCRVEIKTEVSDGLLTVSVTNSGSNIPEDILSLISTGEVEPRGSGIGLTNIHSRLVLLFGEASGLRILNNENTVSVQFSVPDRKD